MSELLLYNARIFNESSYDVIGINQGKIVLLKQSTMMEPNELLALISESKQALDLGNKWVTPGLIDCHTHLIYGGSRSNEFAMRLAGKSYSEITQNGGGINSTVHSTRNLSLEELVKIAEPRIEQMIKNGVTTIEIKSGYGLNWETEKKILQAANYLQKNYPITIQKTFLGAHILPKIANESNKTAQQYIHHLCEDVLPDLVQHNLVDAVDAFCENIAFTKEEIRPLFKKAKEYNLKIKGHTEQLSRIGGAELVCEFNGLSCDHLEYANEEIIKLMHQSKTTAVLLPGAYYYLNETQKPPIDLLRQYNVPMAIATDFNPGTSPIISLATVMNMACVLYRLTPDEAWAGVTHHAALALGLGDMVGSIEIGKQADLVVWNFEHPHDMCYYLGYNWNKMIIQNGKIVFDSGEAIA